MDLPICKRCGHRVTVATDAKGVFSAWCWCEATSTRSDDYRGVGRGLTQEAAIEAWVHWTSAKH